MVDLGKIKTLCILFPGGAGGHHLANLISCCEGFVQTISNDTMLDLYKKHDNRLKIVSRLNSIAVQSFKTHFFDHNHYFINKINSPDYPSNTDKIEIVTGHSHMYHSHQSVLEKIPSPFWIMMSWAEDDTAPGIRRIKLGATNQVKRTYDWPNTYIQHSTPINDDNGFLLETEKFWTADGSQYLRELLMANLGLSLPEIADEMHSLWYGWMDRVITEKIYD
jgi:hypothetical protein